MTEPIWEAASLRELAKSQRKRGDAYRKRDREADALAAFKKGADFLQEAVLKLKAADGGDVPTDLAETYGALGGLLRRIGDARQDDALQAYSDGARLEKDFNLSSTYNRLNAIKLNLLKGKRSLAELENEIALLANSIEGNLRTDSELRESGWAYADLGDCYVLSGNLDDAKDAYEKFIKKAEINSPESTLMILGQLAEKLIELRDPLADRVTSAIESLKTLLTDDR